MVRENFAAGTGTQPPHGARAKIRQHEGETQFAQGVEISHEWPAHMQETQQPERTCSGVPFIHVQSLDAGSRAYTSN